MASKANLVLDQGSSFSTVLTLTDDIGDRIDLSTSNASAQMRKWYTSSNAINFTTSINIEDGTVTLSLTANQTNSVVAGRYVYDVELTDTNSGETSRIVEGIVTVTPQVAR